MRRRPFDFVAGGSLTLFAVILALWARSFVSETILLESHRGQCLFIGIDCSKFFAIVTAAIPAYCCGCAPEAAKGILSAACEAMAVGVLANFFGRGTTIHRAAEAL